MLALGRGWGISLDDGTLVASTLVLPYGGFAWISMVLVMPEHRRKGHASRLLRIALDDLRASRLKPILDATPAGREVYRPGRLPRPLDFQALRAARAAAAPSTARPAAPSSGARRWSSMSEAFGGDREWLLRGLQ